MGVQVAKAKLAGAVSRSQAIGCISSVGLGSIAGSMSDYINESNRHLEYEIRNARLIAPKGVLAVNVMVAISNYDEIVKVCVREKVDIIISGAGVPLKLPELTAGSSIKLIPVISSARAATVIFKTWHRRYQRMPDAIIIEGPLCGGHLAFTREQIAHPEGIPLSRILKEVQEVAAPYEAEYGRKIPFIGAEAICGYEDVLIMLKAGFDGVQVGTRFICSEESGIDPKSKEVYVNAGAEDITVIQSPLGMPLRVIRTPLVERLLRGDKIKFGCPFRCLRSCDARAVKFCLADAMVKTLYGNIDEGIFSTGCAIGRCNELIPAEEFFIPFHKNI